MLKLLHQPDDSIPVSYMPDGCIAIITQLFSTPDGVGMIVQRNDTRVTILGSGNNDYYHFDSLVTNGCRVRILPPGTKLEV